MKRWLPVAALLCVCFPAHAAQHLYAVSINGKDSEQTLLFDGEGAALAAQVQALAGLGIAVPKGTTGDVTLATLGITGKVDDITQTVNLLVPARLLPMQDVGVDVKGVPHLSPHGSAVALSYDIAAATNSGDTAWSFGHTLEVPTPWGLFWTSGMLDFGGSQPGYVRTQTGWRFDDEKHLLSYSAGDVMASTPTGIAPLGGFEISHEYSALAPQYQTWPSPTLDGLVLNPGSLQVLANQTMVTQKDVSAGPLSITALPPIGGGLQHLQAVVQDSYGRTAVIADSTAYLSQSLLRPGLSTWDFAIGSPRQGVTDGYTGMVATGDYSRGVTDWLTLGGAGAVGSGGWSGALSADATLGTLGEIKATAGTSSGGGSMFSAAYTYSDPTRGWSVSLAHSQQTRMWQPNASLLLPVTRQDSVRFGWQRGRWNWHLSASRSQLDGQSYNFFDAGGMWHHGNFGLDFGAYGAGQDKGFYVDANIHFGRASMDAGVRGDQGYASASMSAQTWGASLNSTFDAQGDARETARGMWMTAAGRGSATLSHSASGNAANLDWSGSLLFSPLPRPSRSIAQTDGMVDVLVPGVAGVPVHVGGRYVGKTDRRGQLLFGPVAALVPVRITIDVQHIPMDVVVSRSSGEVVAARGGVARIVFAAEHQTSRAFVLQHDGQPVPANLMVHAGSEETTTAYDGVVVLASPKAGGIIQVGTLCSAAVPTPVPAFDAAPPTLECK